MWLEIGQNGFELIGQVTCNSGNWGNQSIVTVLYLFVLDFCSGLQIESLIL